MKSHSFKTKDQIQPERNPDVYTPALQNQQHTLGNMEFRKELARSVGLDGVPDSDPRAIERIKKLWSEEIGTDGFDSVNAIREVRNW